MIDPETLSDEQLDELMRDLSTEQQRRRRLESTPQVIRDMARQFLNDGGVMPTLVAALSGENEEPDNDPDLD